MAQNSERRRYDIASAAMRLFIERGYSSVTVEQIAAEVGIGVRTFFRYFATKEDAAFPDHEDRVARYTEALRQRRGGPSPVDAVARASAASIRDYFDDPQLYRRRYLLIRSEPALRTHERAANAAYEGAIIDFLEGELEDARGIRLYARAVAAAVVASVDAILDDWATDPSMDPDGLIEVMLDMVARLAAAMPGAPSRADQFVLVVADDPQFRRELIRVVDAHRRSSLASAEGSQAQLE